MSVNTIINTWSSLIIPNKRNYLIINELLKLYSKFTGTTLVNLNNLNEVYNTFGWYIDKNKGNIYQVNLIVNSIHVNKSINQKEILEALKSNTYFKLNFYMENMKRNQICDARNIFESINIYEPGQSPEYFKIIDINTEELAINTKEKLSGKRPRSNSVQGKRANKMRKQRIQTR